MSETVVRFNQSNIIAKFNGEQANLLEFAEANNIEVSFGCRIGACGSCKVCFSEGKVKPLYRSGVDLDNDEVLLCCSVPDGQELVLEC